MPITEGWYVGQRVMFWLSVGQRWTEGLLKEVHNDPARKFFKAVVETTDGFVQYIWQESGLMLMPMQEEA